MMTWSWFGWGLNLHFYLPFGLSLLRLLLPFWAFSALSTPLIFPYWHQWQCVSNIFTMKSYMLASELRCSIILFHHVHLVLLGSVFDISDQLHPSTSLTFLYVIFIHVLVRSWSDDPLCIIQSSRLVYLVDLLVLDMRTCFTFSKHGYARLRQCFFLISFCGLAWWTLVKSFSVFDRFLFHVLT